MRELSAPTTPTRFFVGPTSKFQTYLGRTGAAVRLYESVVADYSRVLGADHPNTLKARRDLATSYHLAGQVDSAIRLFETTLADQERVLGLGHLNTLDTRC